MKNFGTITSYFQVSKTGNIEDGKKMSSENNIKQRSLSLKRPSTPKMMPATPSNRSTSPKKALEEASQDISVVDLTSDSENEESPSKKRNVTVPPECKAMCTPEEVLESFPTPPTQDNSNSSDDFKQKMSPTVNLSPQSAESIVCNVSPSDVWVTPKTPSKPPRTPTKSPSTPSSSNKYFSPTKKRCVPKKTPVKRKLSLSSSQGSNSERKRDDKPYFLLSIVEKYLETDRLKCLLEEDSQQLLSKFVALDYIGMKIVCRLYWLQPGWHTAEQLVKMTDVEDLGDVIRSLVDCGFIFLSKSEGTSVMEFDDYFKILRKPEIDGICKHLKIKTNSKANAVESLKSFCKQKSIRNFFTVGKDTKTNESRVLELLQSTAGICYKMSDLARTTLYNLYVLMYLGMDFGIIRDKKLEYMLIRDKTNDETYPVSKELVLDDASVVFQDKEEFYRYLDAYKVYEEYLANEENIEVCAEIIRKAYDLYKGIDKEHMQRCQSLPTWLRKFTAASAYVKVMEKGVQVLKRLKSEEHYKFAVDILELLINQTTFRTHKKAVWYAEEALILQKHLKDTEKAAKVFIEGFKSDLPEQLKDAMKPRAKVLANQKNITLDETLRDQLRRYASKDEILEGNLPGTHIYKQPMDNFNMKGKLKFTEHTADGKAVLSVEETCRSQYLKSGEFTHGEHWEGNIATTIFSLLFFDIIYSPLVPGVFLTYYQRYPLDMFSDSFYSNRKQDIDDRLKFIEEGNVEDIVDMMKQCWDGRPPSELSDIRRTMAWESVAMVTLCLGPRATAAICRRLATNYAYTHSGFPDLTMWNIHTKKVKFVEVKSDSDKPSVKQLQWLRYLLNHGMDAGFCYVGVNTTRCQARAGDSDGFL